MIELTDNINWNNFLSELKPESWYKKREGESNVDWINRVAVKGSGWLEKYKERKRNRYWRQQSLYFCFSVLSFLRENNLSVEQMEDELGMELDLSGNFDYRMSETEKIKNYIILYERP